MIDCNYLSSKECQKLAWAVIGRQRIHELTAAPSPDPCGLPCMHRGIGTMESVALVPHGFNVASGWQDCCGMVYQHTMHKQLTLKIIKLGYIVYIDVYAFLLGLHGLTTTLGNLGIARAFSPPLCSPLRKAWLKANQLALRSKHPKSARNAMIWAHVGFASEVGEGGWLMVTLLQDPTSIIQHVQISCVLQPRHIRCLHGPVPRFDWK